ncbi:MAG: metal-dependent hydrolase [Planctomycetota bacterium]
MAGFREHITGSTIVGCVYGYWGSTQGIPLESCVLAAGLCSISGMLPDLDSDSGIPLRETSMFASAVVPMLMIDRFRDLGLTREEMAFAALLIYLFIRFGLFEFFKRFTVHRGMWHSLPAAASAGLLAYLLMPCSSEMIRYYKSIAVVAGFLTHLVMDEIWSIDVGRMRIKKSFGTALKFWGSDTWANFSVYAKLALLLYVATSDYGILDRLRQRELFDRPAYIQQPSIADSGASDSASNAHLLWSRLPSWFDRKEDSLKMR